LSIEIIGDAKGLQKAFGSAGSDAEKLGGKFDKLDAAGGLRGAEAGVERLGAAFGSAGGDVDRFGTRLDDLDPANIGRLEADAKRAGSGFLAAGGDVDAFSSKVRGLDGSQAAEVEDRAQRAGQAFIDAGGDVDRFSDRVRMIEIRRPLDAEQNVRRLGDAFDDTSRRTDNTRSVVANFAGNASQELPGVAAAMGPLNMAIGQFAEYASEGNISFKNFVKAGAGLGVATVAMMGISTVMEKVGQRAKELKEETKLLVGVQEDLRDARFEEAASKLEEEYRGTISAAKDFGYSTQDVIAQLTGERDIIGELDRALQGHIKYRAEGIVKYDEEGQKLKELRDNLDIATEAYGNAEEQVDTTRTVVDELTEALEGNRTTNAAAAKFGVDVFAASVDAAGAAAIDIQGPLEGARRGFKDAGAAAGVVEDAMRDMRAQYDLLTGRLNTENSFLELQNTFDDLEVKAKESWAAAVTGAEDAERAAREHQIATNDVKLEVMAYGDAIGGIPPSKLTEINAAIDRGDFDTAVSMLDGLARERASLFAPEVDTWAEKGVRDALDRLTRDRQVRIAPIYNGRAYASGTTSAVAGPALVGENGPEIVNLQGGERIYTAAQTRHMLGSGGGIGGGVVVNVGGIVINGNAIHEQDLARTVHDAIIDGVRRGSLIGIAVTG